MKKLIFLLPLAFSLHAFAQKDSIIRVPLKKGIVFYEKTVTVNGAPSKAILYKKAVKWFKTAFAETGAGPKIVDKRAGKITGNALFKVNTSASGNYFWVKPVVTILVSDGSYTFQSHDFYVKPIMPGVTNEYSELEYRWWDYSRGKPWKPDDQPLFKGLNEYTLGMMAAFETAMNQ